jgi:hypothetical protein
MSTGANKGFVDIRFTHPESRHAPDEGIVRI